MKALCLHRTDTGPYYCVDPEDHEGEHNPRNARVIVRTLEAKIENLTSLELSPDEKDALSKAIHYRIPELQRTIRDLDTKPDVASYADAQLQALFRIATRHDVP